MSVRKPYLLTVGSFCLSDGSGVIRLPENDVITFGAASDSDDVTLFGADRAGALSKTVLT